VPFPFLLKLKAFSVIPGYSRSGERKRREVSREGRRRREGRREGKRRIEERR
jgi:hypothetical protein